MSQYFITGKLGGGKTLVSVGRIRDYLLAGKRVATNLDLNLENLIPRDSKNCEVFRLPDKPTIEDLNAIGHGTYSRKDEDFGLLVLDELGTWLNSRTYQKDKSRQDVIDWFLHARKLGWDLLLIVQDVELIDKQVRISLGEHTVICRRTDRIPLPIISTVIKVLTGYRLKFPRMHVGTVFYGAGQGAIKVDNWLYRGNSLFKAYDTAQVFENNENRVAQFIPPALMNQKKFAVKNWRFYMTLTKIYWKRFKAPVYFVFGLCLNFIFLITFLGFSGSKSDALVVDPLQNSPEKLSKLDSSVIEDNSEMALVQLSYIITSSNDTAKMEYFYNGALYTDASFPEKIIWMNSKPYYYAEVIEDEDLQ